MSTLQRFIDRFEADDGSFVYRQTPHARGVRVSAEERDRMVATFDDRHDTAVLFYVADLPIAAVVAVVVAMIPATKPWSPSAFWIVLVGLPIAAGFWASLGPDRIIRGRPFADEGLPQAEAQRRTRAQTSWPVLAIVAAGGVASGLSVVGSTDTPWFLRLLGGIAVVIAIPMYVREAVLKYRDGTRNGRPEAGPG